MAEMTLSDSPPKKLYLWFYPLVSTVAFMSLFVIIALVCNGHESQVITPDSLYEGQILFSQLSNLRGIFEAAHFIWVEDCFKILPSFDVYKVKSKCWVE